MNYSLVYRCLDSDNLCGYVRTTMERQKEKQTESLAKYLKEGKLALVSGSHLLQRSTHPGVKNAYIYSCYFVQSLLRLWSMERLCKYFCKSSCKHYTYDTTLWYLHFNHTLTAYFQIHCGWVLFHCPNTYRPECCLSRRYLLLNLCCGMQNNWAIKQGNPRNITFSCVYILQGKVNTAVSNNQRWSSKSICDT